MFNILKIYWYKYCAISSKLTVTNAVYMVLHIVRPPPQQNWATPQHKPLYF